MFALPSRAEGKFYDGKDESTEIYGGDGGRNGGNDDNILWGGSENGKSNLER